MGKKRIQMTTKKIAELKESGRGQGDRESYHPWITIHDFPSKGEVYRVQGIKIKRIFHLLSKLEYRTFLLYEWNPAVIDIREQFPLFDEQETIEIARNLGIKHPMNPKNQTPIVLTTDFVITLVDDDRSQKKLARTVKYSGNLRARRVMEKFEIERVYWQRRGIDWGIITENEISTTVVKNIKLIRDYFNIFDYVDLTTDELTRIRQRIFSAFSEDKDQNLRNLAFSVDSDLGFLDGTTLSVIYHMIANRDLMIDMKVLIDPSKPLQGVSYEN